MVARRCRERKALHGVRSQGHRWKNRRLFQPGPWLDGCSPSMDLGGVSAMHVRQVTNRRLRMHPSERLDSEPADQRARLLALRWIEQVS